METWQDQVFGNNIGFKAFTFQHGIPVLVFLVCTILWILIAKNWNHPKQYRSAFLFSLSLAFAVLWWMVFRLWNNQFDETEDLPFHLCNILALIFPFALYFRARWFFGILYFWILAGTLQAVITPDLKEQFPHYIYFRYWWIHCGMISLIFYGLFVFKWKIYWIDIKNAIVGANVYLVFSILVNLLTGGNYFFSMRKPESASLLDHLGPWPWYLFTGQIVMTALFLLLYLPIWWWQGRVKINTQ
ncbi:MAG: TIGR02206 family membrane protein [Saprospiraceae bacterium]|nr:TIGR02206 family membrane protein [Saprospiraceae bacterium]MBK9722075.1 TIGR02206 family membrane protein [Saprospiraceae bacterium]MBK9729122.1 TIGR02206 family membrane protein [Saprospiraceae bacterium]